jgi:mannose-6-phosphate isomerase-like protein (cupin superfamily)
MPCRVNTTVQDIAAQGSTHNATTCGVNHLSLAELLAAPAHHGRSYAEVLRVEALSAGVYELRSGAADPQEPHAEDEVYVVLRGRAQATIDGHTFAVTSGSFLYVPAHVLHRFHDIEEDLAVLVLFAPAEGTGASEPAGGRERAL